jgi:hypothetical protein
MLGAPCWGNCQSRRLRGSTVATLAPPDASYASGEGHDLHDLDAPGRTLPVHEVEGLVGLTARGGSSPPERMLFGWRSVLSRRGPSAASSSYRVTTKLKLTRFDDVRVIAPPVTVSVHVATSTALPAQSGAYGIQAT